MSNVIKIPGNPIKVEPISPKPSDVSKIISVIKGGAK